MILVLGSSPAAIRAPSVLAMAVAAGFTAALGRRLAATAGLPSPAFTGLLAGLLLVAAPQATRYAQEARAYGIVTMLATVATYLLVRSLADGRWRWWAGYGAALASAGLFNLFSLLLIAALSADPANVIFNQFAEFGNHLVHYLCTGTALENVFQSMRQADPGLRLAAFVSASGSAGTLGAGDYLKDRYDSKIVAVEALECPTMLANGFGDHNIQGIGDKHIPLIHNVMNTDFVAGISDRATDQLSLLFATGTGLEHLRARRGVPEAAIEALPAFGLSSICNVLAAVKTAKYLSLGPDDVVITVATDGAEMYESERQRITARDFPEGFDARDAAEVFGRWLLAAGTDNLLETTLADRERIFNLGYFTWVEQQGVSLADFQARRDQRFWAPGCATCCPPGTR